MPECFDYAAKLRKAPEPPYQRIARMRAALAVAQQFVAMIGAERDIGVGPASCNPALLFVEQYCDQRHHVGIAFQVRCFLE